MNRQFFARSLAPFLLALALLLTLLPSGRAQAAPQTIYADALAAGWQNYSWATVNLNAASPVHAGSASIAVTYGAWQGLFLNHSGLNTAGFTKLRFFIHGGSAGGQRLQVYVNRISDPSGAHGPAVAVASPAANAWREVQIPLADLGAASTTITGITWQDTTGGSQPVLYIDDIALIGDESLDGPALSEGRIGPAAAPADGATSVVVRVQVSDPQGLGDLAGVSLDAAALGRGRVALRDDGRSNDGAASDGVYGGVFSVATGTAPGEYNLVVTAEDKAGNKTNLPLGAFVVLARPGGSIPSGMPQRFSLGTSEWNREAGKDWQVNSGVPWNYAYQYITYGWENWNRDANGNPYFVDLFVKQAWSKNYIPVISVYMMLEVPPATGEGGPQYASKLQNADTVRNYLASLERAAQQARGDKPAIFQLEPDFYGFMQQLSNRSDRPAGVHPDDPASFPVALNVPGYPNNLVGFGKRMVDVVRAAAPNVLVAPHASMWATNQDPQSATPAEAMEMARRTAAFINAMGGAESDLFFVEWSDRDAGSGLRPWWDDTNRALPHLSRAMLWKNTLSAAAGKRLVLWQVPVGNIELDNTCDRYRDNRVMYISRHPRDLFDAGVAAVLFGAGAACMTRPSTDGGVLKMQGDIAYALPAAPTGLSAGTPNGGTVPLRWNENSEPDLWGYRVSATPSDGSAPFSYDARRANAASLALPRPGTWQITVAAYDAMGQTGPASAAATVAVDTVTAAAGAVFVPFVQR